MSDRPRLPAALSTQAPKGEQLREIMAELIATLAPGTSLPSERELAARYGVARMTVRTEIDRLVSEGLVYRMHGRGTFVAEPRVTQAATLTSFTEDMRERGLTPGSRVLAADIVVATSIVAGRLELPDKTPVVRIHRVRTGDDEPLAVEEAFLPAARFEGLEDADLEHESLFTLLATRYEVELAAGDQRVVAVSIGELDATLLQVDAGMAGLLFHTTVRDTDGRPVCLSSTLYRGDKSEVRISQVRT